MSDRSIIRIVSLCGAVLSLVACTLPPEREFPKDSDLITLEDICCKTIDVYPDPIVDLMEPKAETSRLLNGSHYIRRPYLEDKTQTHAYILRHLQPMDILLTSDKSQVSGWLIPGYFTHSLLYLGTEQQLQSAGLWDAPALRPHHGKIRAGNLFYEATPPQVTFSPAQDIFDVDSVAVFRPDLSKGQKRAAISRMISHLGKPFDMRMDLATADCLFCAELLNLALPELNFKRQSAYGRQLIAPDSIAVQGLNPQSNLRFIGVVFGQRQMAETGSAEMLAATIQRHWPDRSRPSEAN